MNSNRKRITKEEEKQQEGKKQKLKTQYDIWQLEKKYD